MTVVDEERQWFKSAAGSTSPRRPGSQAFCAHAILDEGVLVVPDATADPRFADNPLVTAILTSASTPAPH